MKIAIFILLLFFEFSCSAQENSSFKLTGEINYDSGQIELSPILNKDDYPPGFIKQVPVRQGRFSFIGNISVPYEVGLKITEKGQTKYISGDFFIDPGVQSIKCNIDSLRVIPDIKNKTMFEFMNRYRSPEFLALDTVHHYEKKHALMRKYLYNYVGRYPDSYVSLWQIIEQLPAGYNSELDSAFVLLSPNIKESVPGKIFSEKFIQMAVTDYGKTFPELAVIDLDNKIQVLPIKTANAKYLFLDFWFSHCSPCRAQFPLFVKYYNEFHKKGLEIIGISWDFTPDNIDAWKNVIKSDSLTWPHYRADLQKLQNLGINLFPTNFVLDSSGKILAKDLSTEELLSFLKINLN